MKLKCLTIFFAVLAAASLARTAHAQDFGYDSYGVYDPYSNEISGYSITVDFMGYGVDLEADSNLVDQGTIGGRELLRKHWGSGGRRLLEPRSRRGFPDRRQSLL